MRSRALVAVALACSACSAAPPPAPQATVDVAPPPAPMNTRFRGHITVDMVGLSDHDVGSEGEALESEANARLGDLLSCMRTMPPAETELWIVGRVGEDGRFGGLALANDVPDDVATCAKQHLSTIHVPSVDPIALSVFLYAEPSPADCKGDDCKRIPVPSGNDVSVSGPPDEEDAVPEALQYGMIGLVGTGDGATGFGPGGLGLAGVGEGGGGIGLGSIGTIGHGAGLGTGFGIGGGKRTKPPSVRMGAVTVEGRLPPEVIQRIVRQNFGRFRLCYEQGLKTDPKLTGVVRTTFKIERDGSISSVADDKSDLPDSKVAACVVNAFKGLSFPQPEGGTVKVVYPIAFSPPEEPPALKIGGVGFREIDVAKIAAKLATKGWKTGVVAAPKPGDSFAVFAVQANAPTNPFERPQGFLTSVRRVSTDHYAGLNPLNWIESEGVRLQAAGDHPSELLQDLVDPQPEKPAK